jgi:hypothetical protein
MNNKIQEFLNILTFPLCKDIIKLFLKNKNNIQKNDLIYNYFEFEIPKNSNIWRKIETILYKQLLIHFKKYKELSFKIDSIDNDTNLNNILTLDSFVIQEYNATRIDSNIENFNKKLSRYNILTFIYCLNTTINGNITFITDKNEKTVINFEKGKLIIFPEILDWSYNYNLPDEPLYIITGQLKLKNDS